jgi:glycogen operon protein
MINDTGCGNTLDFAYAPVRELTLAALRHFVEYAGVDGFRFDLAPVLARGPE